MRKDRLEAYPKLMQWYLENQSSPPQSSDQVGALVWSICDAMCKDDDQLVRLWSLSLKRFFHSSQTSFQSFCEAENVLASSGLDFMHLATEVAEMAIRKGEGDEHYDMLDEVVGVCDIPVFRFLAAWTALNCGKLDECVDHCEAVDDPFACIYTLLGQAQLELGQAQEAIESLKIAVELGPNEIIAMFQLAKAYHVTDQYTLAWDTLISIEKLIPKNHEVEAFFAMVALSQGNNEEYLSSAWQKMSSHFSEENVSTYQIGLMLDLAFMSKQQDRLRFLLDKAPWQRLKSEKEFMANIPWILRKLEDSGWQGFIAPLLDKVAAC